MKKPSLSGGETSPYPSRNRLVVKSCVLVASALAVTFGCDIPSSRRTEVPGPAHTATTPDLVAEKPKAPSDGRVSLPQALAYAKENAPEAVVASAEAGLGDAEVTASKQVQPFNPTLSVGLGQRRQAGGTGLDAQVALTQQIEIAGQRGKRRESAQMYRELTQLGIDAAAWTVHADVHRAFERALLAQERLTLADERVEVAKELLRVAERKVEVGEESSLVVDVANAELCVAENTATAAAADVEEFRLLLASAIGWPSPPGLEPVGRLDAPTLAESGPELIRYAAESSPSVRQAETARRVAEADLETANREAWPSPTVGVSFAREGSTTTPDNFSPSSTIWMGTLQIPIPSFARNQGPVARSRARVKVAEARQRAVSIQYIAMVSAAIAQVNAAARQSAALEGSVLPTFEKSLAALRRSYDVGEMGYLEVAQALDRLWAARQQALDARAAYYEAFADLERLVGPLDSTGSSSSRGATDGGGAR